MRISDWSSDVCSSDLSVSPTAGLISENFADVENLTTGFFAQGYYELTDTIRATGGIRYTWDRRNTVLHNVDRKRVVKGKSVSVGVDLGGRRIFKKKKHSKIYCESQTTNKKKKE